ncbi:MAG: hydrolase TatD [Colwellia sp.]|nr:MAG: hydrolase TatD [Colwellia sp.]
MQFTDSHCHLDFTEFQHELPQLLKQCQQSNINRLIVPSVNPEHWQRVLSLALQTEQTNNTNVKVSCCLGIHPWFLILQNNQLTNKLVKNIDLAFNEQLLKQAVIKHRNEIVAIGECGIDVFKAKKNTESEQALNNNLNLQQEFVEMQLQIAKHHDLPIVIHHCQSHHLILPLLKKVKLTRSGVIHAFSGSYQQAKAYVDLGFKLGIGGTITYARSKKTINAIQRLPLSSLLLETDAPAMPPFGQQGLINTPLNLIAVFKALTTIRSESAAVIAKQIESNVNQLFFNR